MGTCVNNSIIIQNTKVYVKPRTQCMYNTRLFNKPTIEKSNKIYVRFVNLLISFHNVLIVLVSLIITVINALKVFSHHRTGVCDWQSYSVRDENTMKINFWEL